MPLKKLIFSIWKVRGDKMENIIFYLLCFLIEAIIALQYASHLFIAKNPLKVQLIVLSTLYFILFTVSFLNIKWLNMGLYFLANFIFLASQYNLKFCLAVFHSLILAAVMGMCELVVYSSIERFTPHFFVQAEHFHRTIIFIIFSKILFFAVIYVLMHLFKGRKHYNQQHDNLTFLLIFTPITTIFVMFTFVSISEIFLLTSILNQMISLSSIFLLSTNLLVFGINQYNQKKNLEHTEMQLLLQKEKDFSEYYKMLLSQNENQSILIHDTKKHLQSLELLLANEEYSKAGTYIHQLLLSSELKETARVCNHELLNAILSRYKRNCNEQHIAFHADIRNGSTEFMSDTDLTSLFCNLLDNSMEAVCNIQNPFIEINTRKHKKTSLVVITVMNSCLTNPFIDSNGTLNTQKTNKQKHGFGIKSIRKIVDKYQGNMQMYYNEENLSFHTVITLKHS